MSYIGYPTYKEKIKRRRGGRPEGGYCKMGMGFMHFKYCFGFNLRIPLTSYRCNVIMRGFKVVCLSLFLCLSLCVCLSLSLSLSVSLCLSLSLSTSLKFTLNTLKLFLLLSTAHSSSLYFYINSDIQLRTETFPAHVLGEGRSKEPPCWFPVR